VAVLLVGQVQNRFMLLRVEKLGKVGVANFFTKFRGDFDVHIRRFPPPWVPGSVAVAGNDLAGA